MIETEENVEANENRNQNTKIFWIFFKVTNSY